MRVTLFGLLLWILLITCIKSQDKDICNTMKVADLNQYVEYVNDDYGYMQMAYERRETRGRQRIFYKLTRPARVKNVTIMDVRTGAKIFECDFDPSDSEDCCVDNMEAVNEYTPERCEKEHIVYNVRVGDTDYSIAYEKSRGKMDWSNTLIVFQLEGVPHNAHYFSSHEGRDGTRVCPQFARRILRSSLEPLGRSFDSDSRHTISARDLLTKVTVEELTGQWLLMNAFCTSAHTFYVWMIDSDKSTNLFETKIFEPIRINETQTFDHEKFFKLSIQFHPTYRENIRYWNVSAVIGRHSKAILFIIQKTGTQLNRLIRFVLQNWITGKNMSASLTLPAYIQSPAMKLIGLNVTRDAVFVEGQSKRFLVGAEEKGKLSSSSCYKRLSTSDKYKPSKRLLPVPNQNYFEIRKLTVEDSGMYMCQVTTRPQYIFFKDYYIIVLPRKKDTNLYPSTSLPSKTHMPNPYPYYDGRGRAYFSDPNKIFVVCTHFLHRGLDNHHGHSIHYEPEVFQLILKANFTKLQRQFRLHVFAYQIAMIQPAYKTDLKVRCIYEYRPEFDRVHHKETLSKDLSTTIKEIVLTRVLHNEPKFIEQSIDTDQNTVTRGLRNSNISLTDLCESVWESFPSIEALEGPLTGSFVALLQPTGGWVSMFTVLETPNQKKRCVLEQSEEKLNSSHPYWNTTEMNNSHGLIAKFVKFQCMIVVGTKGLLLGTFNAKMASVSEETVEDELFSCMVGPGRIRATASRVDLNLLISTELRLVRLIPKWKATITSGSPIRIQWRPTESEQEDWLHCTYSVDEQAPENDLNQEFKVQKLHGYDIFQLEKEHAEVSDSGIYRCSNCLNCAGTGLSNYRRLVVLPNNEQLTVKLKLNQIISNGSGTYEDPIKANDQIIVVHCEYFLPTGLSAETTRRFTYETGIPEEEGTVLLPTRKQREFKQLSDGLIVHTDEYEVDIPSSEDYWNYTKYTCHLQFTDIIRDTMDILKGNPTINLAHSVFMTYDFHTGPQIFEEYIRTNNKQLTKGLISNKNISVTLVEGVYRISYVTFLGFWEGKTAVFTISEWNGKREPNYCQLISSKPITDPKPYEGLSELQIYIGSGGKGFYDQTYDCLLEPHSEILLIESSILPGNTQKASFVRITDIMGRKVNNTQYTSHRYALLDIRWRASVEIGETVEMLAYLPAQTEDIQCYYKSDKLHTFVPLPNTWKYEAINIGAAAKITLSNVSYSHSGTYLCNTTRQCSTCPFGLVLVPRYLNVLPHESILSMDISPDITEDEIFDQIGRYTETGELRLKADEKATVNCTHQISPVDNLRASLLLIYYLHLTEQDEVLSLHTTNGESSEYEHNLVTYNTMLFSIKSPSIDKFTDKPVRVVCRFTYRPMKVFHDITERPGLIQLIKENKFVVWYVAPPKVLRQHITATMEHLLSNWKTDNDQNLTAAQFHKTVSSRKLEEDNVYFNTIEAWGIPKGQSVLWAIYRYETDYDCEECVVLSDRELSKQNMTDQLIATEAYRSRGGRNIFERNYVCAIQPRHVALAFVIFNDRSGQMLSEEVKSQLAKSVTAQVRLFFSDPTSTHTFKLTTSNKLIQISYGIIKLNIGWKSLVKVGESWRILTRHYDRTYFSAIYYQKNKDSQKMFVKTITTYQNGSMYGKNSAELRDTGIYSCKINIECSDCRPKQCFLPRLLVVLPDRPVIEIRISHLLKIDGQPPLDETDLILGTNHQAFVYCQYIHPELSKVHIKFSLQTEDGRRQLPFETLVRRTNADSGLIEGIQIHRVIGPKLIENETVLVATCSLIYGKAQFDPNDLYLTEKNDEVKVTRSLLAELWLEPFFYIPLTESTTTKKETFLRMNLKKPLSPKAFHDIVSPEPFTESSLEFTLLASVGVPAGYMNAFLFTEQKKSIWKETCPLLKLEPIEHSKVPSELLRYHAYHRGAAHTIVKMRFRCILRRETLALAIIMHTGIGKRKNENILDDAVQAYVDWLRYTLDNPEDFTHNRGPKVPPHSMVSWVTTKLTVKWEASLRAGSRITMFGYKDKLEDQLHCYHRIHEKMNATSLNEGFLITRMQETHHFRVRKLEANFMDSGLYSCYSRQSNCSTCETRHSIQERRLVILPNRADYRLFLTHTMLNATQVWEGNFHDCDENNHPVLNMEKTAYIHCVHPLDPSGWLIMSQHFRLLAYIDNTWKRIRPISSKSFKNSKNYWLNSNEIKLEADQGYGTKLKAVCEWNYQFPNRLEDDIRNRSIKFRFKRERMLSIRKYIHPHIFNEFVVSDDPVVESTMRLLDFKTQNMEEFNNKDYIIRISENYVTMHWIASLGSPRGWFNAWTIYLSGELIYLEDCVAKENKIDFASLPDDFRIEESNFVNMTIGCRFGLEQNAFVVSVHHKQQQQESQGDDGHSARVKAYLSARVEAWIKGLNVSPDDGDRLTSDWFIDYRVTQLLIHWRSQAETGQTVKMLVYKPPGTEVRCLSGQYLHEKPIRRGFKLIETAHGEAFYLTKIGVDLFDSGRYMCSVDNEQSAIPYTNPFVMTPRELVVRPNSETFEIRLTHTFSRDPERNLTQYTNYGKPFLYGGQNFVVFCSYRSIETIELDLLVSLTAVIRGEPQSEVLKWPKLTRKLVEKMERYELHSWIQRFNITTRLNLTGPMNISCLYKHPQENREWEHYKIVEMRFHVEPLMFVDHIQSSQTDITDALRKNLKESSDAQMKVDNSGPKHPVLEGKLNIDYIIASGYPESTSGVHLLYSRHGFVRSRKCEQIRVKQLGLEEIPPTICITEPQRCDKKNVKRIWLTCILTPDIKAISLALMNGKDESFSRAQLEDEYLKLVYESLDQWIDHSGITETQRTVQIPSWMSLKYSIFPVKIGWRSIVHTHEPIVMVGLIPRAYGEDVRCMFHPADRNEWITIGRDFYLNKDLSGRSFELLKKAASTNDSGIYSCTLQSCPGCDNITVLHPRQLHVLSRRIEADILLSQTLENNTWVYHQYLESGRPYAYQTQTLFVICRQRSEADLSTIMKIRLSVNHEKASEAMNTPVNYTLHHTLAELVNQIYQRSNIYQIHIPENLKSPSNLVLNCISELTNMSVADINLKSMQFKTIVRIERLAIRSWRKPTLVLPSIVTDLPKLNTFINSYLMEQWTPDRFLSFYPRMTFKEGPVKIEYTRTIGIPPGWSNLLAIYDSSEGLVVRQCVNHTKYYHSKTQLNFKHKVTSIPSERNQYTCLFVESQVGLFIYSAHLLNSNKTMADLEELLIEDILEALRRWSEGIFNEISWPSDARGDYLVLPTNVIWKSHLEARDPINLYGFFENKMPACAFGASQAEQNLIEKTGFQLKTFPELRYFHFYKPNAELTDMGVYMCDTVQCINCPQIPKFEMKKLFVFPDETVLKLDLKRIQNVVRESPDCSLLNITMLSPKDKVELICSHRVTRGYLKGAYHRIFHNTEENDLTMVELSVTKTVEQFPDHEQELVQSTTKLDLSTIPYLSKRWFVRCQLIHDEIVEFKAIRRQKSFRILDKAKPRILTHQIKTNLNGTLRTVQTDASEKIYEIKSLGSVPIIKEDVATVTIHMKLGNPKGWCIMRTVAVYAGQVLLDNCQTKWMTEETEDTFVHSSRCILQPEHTHILLVAINLPDNGIQRAEAENAVTDIILKMLNVLPAENSVEDSDCLWFDYQVIKITVGWDAIVPEDAPIVMQGVLPAKDSDPLVCFHQKNENSEQTMMIGKFKLLPHEKYGTFELLKENAALSDAGIYQCMLNTTNTKSTYVGMMPRKLVVLPVHTQVHCKVSLSEDYHDDPVIHGNFSDGRVYFLSQTLVYIHCMFESKLKGFFKIDYLFEYEMQDCNSDRWIPMIGSNQQPIGLVEDGVTLITTHSITCPSAETYRGLLRVRCSSAFRNIKSNHSMISFPQDTFKVACEKNFTIQEPANGELQIDSNGAKYERQPVPLGSELVCSGGHGIPLLNYTWNRILPTLYDEEKSDDLAMRLPASGGGWGGPEYVFSDMPSDGLEVEGHLLRVPKDDRYRGMSYMYQCIASNQVGGKRYHINKTIHLTVLICPTDRSAMDLILLHNPRLMSACFLEPSPYPDIKFFGHFYLSLIRQIILGMPYGRSRSRFGLIYHDSNYTFNWPPATFPYDVLLQNLYSKSSRPLSPSTVCDFPSGEVTYILQAVRELYKKGFERNPIFLFPIDNFIHVRMDTTLFEAVEYIQENNISLILAFTHKLDGRFEKFNQKLIRYLKPKVYIDLLPEYNGTIECQGCILSIDDERLRLRRGPIFDAICQLSNNLKPDPIEAPKLSISLPEQYWFPGITLLVTCSPTQVVSTDPREITELVVCLSDSEAMMALIDSVDIQNLIKACHRVLSEKERYTAPKYVAELANTVSVMIEPHNLTLLCYQRLGRNTPKMFDPVNFTHVVLKPVGHTLSDIKLTTTHNPATDVRVITFACSFFGYVANAEVLFVIQLGEQNGMVVTTNLTFDIDNGSSTGVLNWYELDYIQDQSKAVCIVQPRTGKQSRGWLEQPLPQPSDEVVYSNWLTIPNPVSRCPERPKLTHTYVITENPKRFHATCESYPSTISYPLKLYYLTVSGPITICSKEAKDHIVSCKVTTIDDEDCTKEASINDDRYKYNCSLSRNHLIIHHIQFRIEQFTIRDFGAHVFCKTNPSIQTESSMLPVINHKVTSRVHVIVFPFRPYIAKFYYESAIHSWECLTAAYPMNYEAPRIERMKVTPKWLNKQLDGYEQVEIRHVQGSGYTPLGVNYTRLVRFQPRNFVAGELVHGLVKLKCVFGGSEQTLVTNLDRKPILYEPIIPHSFVETNYSRHVTLICTFQSSKTNPIRYISVHRVCDYEWLRFDNALMIESFVEDDTDHGSESHEHRRKFISWWAFDKLATIRVLTDQDDDEYSLGVSLMKATEFDSGHYFCSAGFSDGTHQHTTPKQFRFQGIEYGLALGYRILNESTVWWNEGQTIALNRLIHLRCTLWTTRTDDVPRGILQISSNRVNFATGSVFLSKDQFKTTTTSGIVVKSTNYKTLSHTATHLKVVLCHFASTKKENNRLMVMQGPQVECNPKGSIHLHPERLVYSNRDKIQCKTNSSCHETVIEWQWIAGPLPQLTALSDDMRHVAYGDADMLLLDKLPRGGTYIFACRVQCSCGTHIRVRVEKFTISLSVRKEWLKTDKDMDDTSQDRQDLVPDVSLPSIDKDDSQLLAQYKEMKTEVIGRQLPQGSESFTRRLRRLITQSFRIRIPVDSLIQYPVRRNSKHQTVTLTPELVKRNFISYDHTVDRFESRRLYDTWKHFNLSMEETRLVHRIRESFRKPAQRLTRPDYEKQLEREKRAGGFPENAYRSFQFHASQASFKFGILSSNKVPRSATLGTIHPEKYGQRPQSIIDVGWMGIEREKEDFNEVLIVPMGKRPSFFGLGGIVRSGGFPNKRERERKRYLTFTKDHPVVETELDRRLNLPISNERRARKEKYTKSVSHSRENQKSVPLFVSARELLVGKEVQNLTTLKMPPKRSEAPSRRFRIPDESFRQINRLENLINYDFSKYNTTKMHRYLEHEGSQLITNLLLRPKPWLDEKLPENGPLFEDGATKHDEYIVFISPPLIILPDVVNVLCPIDETLLIEDHMLSELRWYRAPSLNSPAQRIVAISMDEGLGDQVFAKSTFYLHPSQTSTGVYSMHMYDPHLNDFGYYHCERSYHPTTQLKPGLEVIAQSQYPLCIMTTPNKPKLIIVKAQNNTMQLVQTMQLYSMQITEELNPSEQLFIVCEVRAHEMYCEENDKSANGTRLIDTKMDLYIASSDDIVQPERVADNAIRYQMEQKKFIQIRSFLLRSEIWRLTMVPDLDATQMTCKTRAQLTATLSDKVRYSNWLQEQFNQRIQRRLQRKSQSIWLRLNSTYPRLLIRPKPKARAVDHFEVLVAYPKNPVNCRMISQLEFLVDFKVYEIIDMPGAGANYSQTAWLEDILSPVDWPKVYGDNQVTVIIPENTSIIGNYFIICEVVNTMFQKMFLLQVNRPTKQSPLPVRITTSLMVVLVLLGGLILHTIKQYRFAQVHRIEKQLMKAFSEPVKPVPVPELHSTYSWISSDQ